MKLLYLLITALIAPVAQSFHNAALPEGAYVYRHANGEDWLMLVDNYLVETSFNKSTRTFHYTCGGVIKAAGDGIDCRWEFHTAHPKFVGKTTARQYVVGKNSLAEGKRIFERVEEGPKGMAGYYRITGRKNNGAMNSMPLAPRKTIKVLTGKRFQWAAINTATGEFFGTGGGSYTFDGSSYTEHIEFFSRDSSRVGASLTFTDTLTGASWIHTGMSSKGDPIYEIWTREPIAY